MDEQNVTSVRKLLALIIERNVSQETYAWLLDKATQSANKDNNYQFNLTFTSIPRKTGKKEVAAEDADIKNINILIPGFTVQHWTIDKVSRVWLLMNLETTDKDHYITRIENLFPQAEMNELVALYSALPVLAYPEAWILRCAEGIRSNIGTVLEAIMYYNPYPAAYLNEAAWNQLVMRAFFTDKNVNNIIGLDERTNQNLANILFDYVEERWAADRIVNPQIWRLVGKFMDDSHLYMLEQLFQNHNETEQQAAALTCRDSSFEKAVLLLDQYPQFKRAIEQKTLTWEIIANK
jgi:hypothetical protein